MTARARILLPVAFVALAAGFAIYAWARPDSLFGLGAAGAFPLSGQLPSFLHTLAFALASATVVSPATAPRMIAGWTALEALAESSQHAAAPVPGWLAGYRGASTFDPLDLIAIGAAGAAALALTTLTRRHDGNRPLPLTTRKTPA